MCKLNRSFNCHLVCSNCKADHFFFFCSHFTPLWNLFVIPENFMQIIWKLDDILRAKRCTLYNIM